jgi:hypothetical protein
MNKSFYLITKVCNLDASQLISSTGKGFIANLDWLTYKVFVGHDMSYP